MARDCVGADAGNEFIELYNADSEPAWLDNYVIAIGSKQYKLPAGVVIAPDELVKFAPLELDPDLVLLI